MTQETTAVPSLRRWGVSADADLLYRALVMMGPRSSGQVARELGIALARVNRGLDELAALGAARPVSAAARIWTPTPPDRVLPALRRPRTALCGPAEQWQQQTRALAGIDLDIAAPGTVQRLRSRTLARQRISELMTRERHEHLALNTEEVISADAVRAALPLDRSIRTRGVRLRVIGLPTANDIYRDFASPAEIAQAEGNYREADTLPLKLMIFDRRSALFPADPRDFDAGAVLVTDPAAVESLTRFFYRLWATARDARREGVAPIVLTVREQALIALLTAGHTEQSAAEELRVSKRTVAYTLRGLMDRLQVANRFQLGLVLGGTRTVPLPEPYDDARSYPSSTT